MVEKSRIESEARTEEDEEVPMSGYCDRCSAYNENLKERNGQNICDECRVELEQEK